MAHGPGREALQRLLQLLLLMLVQIHQEVELEGGKVIAVVPDGPDGLRGEAGGQPVLHAAGHAPAEGLRLIRPVRAQHVKALLADVLTVAAQPAGAVMPRVDAEGAVAHLVMEPAGAVRPPGQRAPGAPGLLQRELPIHVRRILPAQARGQAKHKIIIHGNGRARPQILHARHVGQHQPRAVLRGQGVGVEPFLMPLSVMGRQVKPRLARMIEGHQLHGRPGEALRVGREAQRPRGGQHGRRVLHQHAGGPAVRQIGMVAPVGQPGQDGIFHRGGRAVVPAGHTDAEGRAVRQQPDIRPGLLRLARPAHAQAAVLIRAGELPCAGQRRAVPVEQTQRLALLCPAPQMGKTPCPILHLRQRTVFRRKGQADLFVLQQQLRHMFLPSLSPVADIDVTLLKRKSESRPPFFHLRSLP